MGGGGGGGGGGALFPWREGGFSNFWTWNKITEISCAFKEKIGRQVVGCNIVSNYKKVC